MFTLTKLTPPPPALNNLFKYLILLSILTLPVHAKTIHRQAYKVCEAQEEAYWNGSSAQCCDTTTHKLVKNYKDGVGEAGYACCEIKEDKITSDGPDESASTGRTVIGAANGSCCGGYTSYQNSIYGTIEVQRTSTYTIRQNGEIYYCALEQTSSMYGELQQEDVYVSDSQFCKYFPQNGGETIVNCTCSDSGDPRNGSSCDP